MECAVFLNYQGEARAPNFVHSSVVEMVCYVEVQDISTYLSNYEYMTMYLLVCLSLAGNKETFTWLGISVMKGNEIKCSIISVMSCVCMCVSACLCVCPA